MHVMTKYGFHLSLITRSGIVQLPAHNVSVDIFPVVITHSAPYTIVAYLHSALGPDPPSNQSYIAVHTWSIGT